MPDTMIRVEALSKSYLLGRTQKKDDTLRDQLVSVFSRLHYRRHQGNNHAASQDILWALRNVSFEVKRGEVIGVIGRNGAGKSTLLKILTRITEPTQGRVEIRGRVASLLEVGTGFHPELTGRENIYLNGAILGMRRVEIAQRFDEIVAFAEVDRFLDTPVKRYSSGMYVRLAFAVAAHLEPEILLVDEVLAVGDAAFQRKSIGKMEDVSRQGRTVLFVSHNMAAVEALCSSAILLSQGQVVCYGPTEQVIRRYQDAGSELATTAPVEARRDRGGDGSVTVTEIKIENTDGGFAIAPLSRLRITIAYRSLADIVSPCFLIGIYDRNNTGLIFLDSDAMGTLPDRIPATGSVTCITGPIWLAPRHCSVNVAVFRGGMSGVQADYVQGAASFEIVSADVYGTGKLPPQHFISLAVQEWTIE